MFAQSVLYRQKLVLQVIFEVLVRVNHRANSQVAWLEFNVFTENHFKKICLFFISSLSKNKITQPHAKKLSGPLLVKNDKMVKNLLVIWIKLQRAHQTWISHFCSLSTEVKVICRGHIYYTLSMAIHHILQLLIYSIQFLNSA